MPTVMSMEWPGVTQDQYNQVMRALELDKTPPSGCILHMAGFNSGTLGIPNVHAHAETLRLIRRIIANHSLLHGREALPYADQEIANYVSFRLAHFDTALISRFVRYGGEDAHLGERCGLVHFWPVPGTAARTQAMRDYVTRLGTSQ